MARSSVGRLITVAWPKEGRLEGLGRLPALEARVYAPRDGC